MKVKRVLSMVLTMAIILSMVSTVAYATEPLGVTLVSSVSTAKPGDEVDVTVKIDSNPGIEGFVVSINANPNVFEFVSMQKEDILKDSEISDDETMTFAYAGSGNVFDTGEVYSVKLRVLEDAPEGNTVVSLNAKEIYNTDFQDVDPNITDATITITAAEDGGDDEGEGGGTTTAPTFQMYYTLANPAEGDDAFKDVQLNTAEDAKNLVTAEIFVVSDKNVTLQAYDIYLTYNSNLSYQSEAMDGKAYVNAAAHDVEATAGQTVSHIQMLDDEGTYALTAGTHVSLGTITFDVSKSAEYGQDLYITLADGAINSTNVAVATTGSATGDKTSYWPTVTQEVNGTTYSGVEVMNTYTVSLNANTDKTVTGMPEGNQQTKEYNKPLTLPTLVCPSNELAFKGWTTTVDPSFDAQVQYTPGASYTANAGATLYAVWKQNAYTITLNDNGGTYAADYTAPSTYVFGEGAALPTAGNIGKEHYTFDGWYSNAECTGTPVTEISATDSGNKEYWAKWIPVEYTITFKNEDGTVLQNTKFAYGAMPEYTGATPEKTATAEYTFSFAEWDPTIAEVTGEATYTATYTPAKRSYRVTYAAGEHGSITAKTETVEYGSKPTYTEATPATGYSFDGWYNDGAKIDTETFTVTGPVTLTAKFTANKYTVIFNANGGEGSMDNQEFTYGVAQNLKPNKFTKADANFAGWKVDNAGELISDGASLETLATSGTVTLYAQWTNLYTVTLGGYTDSQGTVTATPQTAAEKTEIILTATAKDGYNFTGFTVKDAEGNDVTVTDGKFTMPASNVIVTATFTAIPYNITVTNDGKGTATAVPNPATVGQTVTLTEEANEGYKLKEYTSDDVTVSEGKFTMPAKAVTVNVAFAPIGYTVQFNKNTTADVVGSLSDVSALYDTDVTTPNITRTGYTLVGWATTADGEKLESVKNLTTTDGATIALYAVWQAKKINVTLDANGGKIENQDTKAITPAFDAAYGELSTPVREGYEFKGWNTVQTPTEETSGVTVTAETKVTNAEDHSLYAQWEAKKYTITYMDGKNAITGLTPATYTIEAAATLPTKDTVTKNGYTFEGWYTEPALTNKVTEIPAGSTNAKTFYAKWETVEYTITFMDSDGTTKLGEKKYTIETEETLDTASKAGYDFYQWEVKTAAGNWTVGTYIATTSVKDHYGDVTMVAQWNRTTMTVVEDYKFAASGYVMLRVEDTAANGEVYTFAGEPMFYIENEYYNINGKGVYYTLVEAKYKGTNNELSAEGYALLKTTSGNKMDNTITYNGDINGDGTVNIADANIVYQMVEQASKGGYYTDLTPAQRLGADMSKAHEQNTDLARGSIDDVNEIIDIINGVPTT